MNLSIAHTRALVGIEAPEVSVETHLSNGLPAFTIVGMPETSVKESKDRVRSAIQNSHFEFPQRRITINLAPADLPKEGSRFDLAIALGILAASNQIPKASLSGREFIGELALNGELRHCRGVIPATLAAQAADKTIVLPEACEAEVALCEHAKRRLAPNLLSVCAYLHERAALKQPQNAAPIDDVPELDLYDVAGQEHAKRALLIAAAGGHNLLFFGPPGSGKSMLASRMPSILPQLSHKEALDLAAIRSVATTHRDPLPQRTRPYRAPHHTASAAALVGGGSQPKPGEISLAHHGVLFLDELPEFNRKVLEVLREPLETGRISISRATAQIEFPASFQLLAAMNPCPCGYYGDGSDRCSCSPTKILKYKDKISGPLIDRIDLQVLVPRLPPQQLSNSDDAQRTKSIQWRALVNEARLLQHERQGCTNAELTGARFRDICALGKKESELLNAALDRFGLSARAHDRILRVARTMADLKQIPDIRREHLSEALSYRNFDRFFQRLSQL